MNSKLNSMSSKLVDDISGKVAEKCIHIWFKELRLCNFLFVLVLMMMMCLYQCVKGWV